MAAAPGRRRRGRRRGCPARPGRGGRDGDGRRDRRHRLTAAAAGGRDQRDDGEREGPGQSAQPASWRRRGGRRCGCHEGHHGGQGCHNDGAGTAGRSSVIRRPRRRIPPRRLAWRRAEDDAQAALAGAPRGADRAARGLHVPRALAAERGPRRRRARGPREGAAAGTGRARHGDGPARAVPGRRLGAPGHHDRVVRRDRPGPRGRPPARRGPGVLGPHAPGRGRHRRGRLGPDRRAARVRDQWRPGAGQAPSPCRTGASP